MAHKKRTARQKHVPRRLCIACRQSAGKRALIRLVRTDTGVEIDETGKKAGRGAYLHPNQPCWDQVLIGNRLDSALRIRLRPENRDALAAFAANLPAEPPALLENEADAE